MMDWTDCHCRYVHRLFAPHALLYTEMIVSTALIRGDARRLLEHHPAEHPVALQLGGCDPKELAAAAKIGAAAGFAEINLNVGCPSDRVKNGSFGACLMLKPQLVADCVRALRDATSLPVTVKCRIGIDYPFFSAFVDAVAGVGIDALIVHARAAILGGVVTEGKSGDTAAQVRLCAPSQARAAGTHRDFERRLDHRRRCSRSRGGTRWGHDRPRGLSSAGAAG